MAGRNIWVRERTEDDEYERWRQEQIDQAEDIHRARLREAYGHLGAALAQSLPTDDQIIMLHVRDAHAILKEALR